MSDFNALSDMTRSLMEILRLPLNAEGGAQVAITAQSPQEDGAELRVNLSLFEIKQDPQRRNMGPVPIASSGRDQYKASEPLALKLRYLMTAYAQDGLTSQRLLGEAIQILHGHRWIPRGSPLLYGSLGSGVTPPVVKIVLSDVEPELLQTIWGSQGQPLRPSVVWEVECVFIEDIVTLAPIRAVESIAGDIIPIPYLSYVYPAQAPAGAEVELRGANLALDYISVWFGDVRAELVGPRTSRRARALVPPSLQPGKVPVTLRLDTYKSAALDFRVGRPEGPWLYRIQPESAAPGDRILLGGQDLDRPGLRARLGEGPELPLEEGSPQAAELVLPSLEALGLTPDALPAELSLSLLVEGVALAPLPLLLISPAEPE